VSFYLGPVLAFNVMGSFWGLSATLVMFREQGILRRFHVAPVTSSDMLASSIVANYILTLPIVFLQLLFARVILHVPSLGNPISLFILISVGIVSFGSLGLVVASVTNTMQETQVINNLLWTSFLFLSGATIPLPVLPRVVQFLALFLPATYLVTGLQKAVVRGTEVWHLGAELLALGAGALFAFFVSKQLFRWEPEQKVTRRAKAWAAATILPFLLLGIWESNRGALRSDAKATFDTMDERAHPPRASAAARRRPRRPSRSKTSGPGRRC